MSIPVPVIAPDGTEHASLTAAARAHGTDRKIIQRLIHAEASGWRYRDGEPPEQPTVRKDRRRVIGPTGAKYSSAEAAAKKNDCPVNAMRDWCRRHYRGWHYQDDPPPARPDDPDAEGLALLGRLGPRYYREQPRW